MQFMFLSIVVIWYDSTTTTMNVLVKTLHLGSRFSKTRGSWSAHELP